MSVSSSYVLSCCSVADVSLDYLTEHNVAVVYFNYNLGGVDLKDDFGKTTPPRELYQRMLAGEECTTSQVSVGDYLAHWKPYLDAGQDVVHLALSSGISGTYESACIAAQEAQANYPERHVYVVDSLSASAGVGLLLDGMIEQRDKGMGAAELAAWAEDHRLNVQQWFITTDLRFFIKGGRISKTAGAIGSMLNICPIMDVEPDGSLGVKAKARGKKRGIKTIVSQFLATNGASHDGADYTGRIFISQSDCFEDAQMMAAELKAAAPGIESVSIFNIGATIGVHTGPGTTAVFWWGEPRA